MKLKNVKIGQRIVVKTNYNTDNELVSYDWVAKQRVAGMTAVVVAVNEEHDTEKVHIAFDSDSTVCTLNQTKTWWVPHECIKKLK